MDRKPKPAPQFGAVPPDSAAAPHALEGTDGATAPTPAEVAGSAGDAGTAGALPDAREQPSTPAAISSDPPAAEAAEEGATALHTTARTPTPPEPRKNTLAAAITRPVLPTERAADETQEVPMTHLTAPPDDSAAETRLAPAVLPPASRVAPRDDLADEIADEVDEWTAADQPTVYLAPRALQRQRPRFLETGEQPFWPPRPAAAAPAPRPPAQRPPAQRPPAQRPPAQRPPAPPAGPAPGRAPARPGTPGPFGQRRLAAPDGRPMPGTPPSGIPRAALPDPRMQRFQELRQRRLATPAERRAVEGNRPVGEIVRRWWSDLLPGLQRALHHQREARASGVHPIPAYEVAPVARLGDAFGRLTASARGVTERAHAAVAPTLKRLHDQAEQGAQALVEKVEGSPTRQQAPLLGPGRIAVFFQAGVSVGTAQSVLAAAEARPIRLIPRKHGFLAFVPPGREAQTAKRLRASEHVRDVAYLEFDEYGQPIEPA
jgi:hypothetical protein